MLTYPAAGRGCRYRYRRGVGRVSPAGDIGGHADLTGEGLDVDVRVGGQRLTGERGQHRASGGREQLPTADSPHRQRVTVTVSSMSGWIVHEKR